MADQETTPQETTVPRNGFQALLTAMAGWPLSKKLSLAAVAVISLSLFAVIIIQARTADYQVLYGNLNTGDAAAVLEWLKGNSIPYQITGNGQTIKVPADRVHEARLQLASAGLPEGGGIGFEIFDKQSFALTDFVQKVNYTRALQGELSRTIAALNPVETARVHLALPEKRLFKEQQKPATASVILNLKPGRRLSESQVQGIVHLVSGSIEGLSPEHVTVIDQNGTVLTRTQEKGLMSGLTPDMLEFQIQVEKNLEERAQTLLDKAVGSNKAMVRVTAALDFSRFEKTEEIYDPEEPVIRSEQISEEKSGSEISGGVPGVQSNLQPTAGRAASATPPSSRTRRTTNYEISKVVSKTVNPVGTIKRLSVSVLVADRIIDGPEKKGKKTVPRSQEELDSLKKMIASALGLDKTRGDKIEIVSLPFEDSTPQLTEQGLAENTLYQFMPFIRYGLILLGGLMVYLLMIRPLIKTMRQEVTNHYKTVQEMEEEQQKAAQAKEQQELEALMRDPVLRVREAIQTNPVFAAHILKSWIHERG